MGNYTVSYNGGSTNLYAESLEDAATRWAHMHNVPSVTSITVCDCLDGRNEKIFTVSTDGVVVGANSAESDTITLLRWIDRYVDFDDIPKQAFTELRTLAERNGSDLF